MVFRTYICPFIHFAVHRYIQTYMFKKGWGFSNEQILSTGKMSSELLSSNIYVVNSFIYFLSKSWKRTQSQIYLPSRVSLKIIYGHAFHHRYKLVTQSQYTLQIQSTCTKKISFFQSNISQFGLIQASRTKLN